MSGSEIASACGGRALTEGGAGGPRRAVVDSRLAGPGDLFVGLRGASTDGGLYAGEARRAGAWGAVVAEQRAAELPTPEGGEAPFWLIGAADPLAALHGLATAWRRRLGSTVIGITGSAGKTTTKDIARTLLPGSVHASAENRNTEVGLPLEITEAPPGTDYLVLEMAMRGPGQIRELAAIAEPGIGVITNVGPVHTELLGSVEAIAAAKAELLEGLADGSPAVVPSDAGALEAELRRHRSRLELVRFGSGGEIEASIESRAPGSTVAAVTLDGALAERARAAGGPVSVRIELPFSEPHNLSNLLAAMAAGVLAGASVEGMAAAAAGVTFSRLRGERVSLAGGITLINDSYNANPISMRAALGHLGDEPGGRRIAVLGPMAELGAEAERHHAEIGEHARQRGIDVLVGVGAEAGWYRPDLLVEEAGEAARAVAGMVGAGDAVLVKGSRSAGLERAAERLEELIGGRDG